MWPRFIVHIETAPRSKKQKYYVAKLRYEKYVAKLRDEKQDVPIYDTWAVCSSANEATEYVAQYYSEHRIKTKTR